MARVSHAASRDHRGNGAAKGEFAELAVLGVVRLARERPSDGLPAGATGTIVEVFERPELAYDVEFLDAQGAFLAEIPVSPDDVSLVERPTPQTRPHPSTGSG